MKKIGLVLCFLFFGSTVFAQQFLWSTVKDSFFIHVPLDSATNKVLEFYDHYKFYYDGAGFSKDGFVKFYEASQTFKTSNKARWNDLKKRIYRITEPTIFAFRSNSGRGSEILVVCINKDDVNLITFSNIYDNDAVLTLGQREKFAKWFKTLLN